MAMRDGAYELRFEPVGSASAATSNHFKIKVDEDRSGA